MTNTPKQSETDQTPKAETKQQDEAIEPAIIGLINEDDTEDISLPHVTPAEIIVDKDMDPQEKRILLLQSYGRKGGLATAKKKTKWKPIFIKIALQLATIGITEADIAALFQVRVATFRGWKRAHEPLRLALKEGEGLKKTTLTMQMQKSAAEGIWAMQIYLSKNWLGMTDRQDLRVKGEQTIIYKSHVPKEKGDDGVDPGSIKGRKTQKIQDREA